MNLMVSTTCAAQNFSQSELKALGEHGPYQLVLRHAHGVIVEYFHATEDALRRQVELEDLLRAAQGFGGSVTHRAP